MSGIFLFYPNVNQYPNENQNHNFSIEIFDKKKSNFVHFGRRY